MLVCVCVCICVGAHIGVVLVCKLICLWVSACARVGVTVKTKWIKTMIVVQSAQTTKKLPLWNCVSEFTSVSVWVHLKFHPFTQHKMKWCCKNVKYKCFFFVMTFHFKTSHCMPTKQRRIRRASIWKIKGILKACGVIFPALVLV